jgi:hypothetical protein
MNAHHGRVHVLAVQNVTTEEQFMTVLNYVIWNLAGWYECDMREFEGEACAVLRYYASALAGCDLPPQAARNNTRRRLSSHAEQDYSIHGNGVGRPWQPDSIGKQQ